MSVEPPCEQTPGRDGPQRLRAGPTFAGALVAFAFGSVALGSICAAPRDLTLRLGAGPLWLSLAATWVAMAACIYGANQAWLGRDRSERVEVFVLCLGIALVVFGVTLAAVAQVTTSLGWWP